ncbi:unnamed protein product [Bursaphelenchus xylophilus]|uniref:(pine wood nematode) hypothetical protein n=1 Tax=Bursaphelenchus xylophilus TaxID=6326 RepID=A0A1I7RUP1_BURXY|nr:unnamed protein product [Bursaphelenchus xylophilus]CAG9114281.1 unnamed protein product [Bursaphelenchus xylophilus]
MLFSNALEPVTDTALLLCTAVESVCAPFILYLALFHSKQMTRYRFLIINNVVWSCLYNWAVCLVKPAFMFPAMCFILDSPLVHRSFWTKVATILTMGFFINIECSVFWCLMYRYCIAYPSLTDFVENSKAVVVVIIVTHCVAYTCAGGPFLLHPIRSSPDQSIERIRLLDQLPHFGEKEPYIGYICAPNIFLARLYCGLGAVFLGLGDFPKTGHYGKHTKDAYDTIQGKRKISRFTVEYFKAVAVQLLVFLLFILFPTSLLMIAVVARWNEGTTLAAGCMLLVQMHGCVDFVTMIYFITPYRKKLLEIVGRASSKRLHAVSSVIHTHNIFTAEPPRG